MNDTRTTNVEMMLVAGARPNFMKIAPIWRVACQSRNIAARIIHTGQHYDYAMSQSFFDDLELPTPDAFLEAGSGSHAEQTGKIMTAFEQLCTNHQPDWIIVVGDVNSTMACTIVAKKLGIRVAHVEAGLRSRDMAMPEEINRMLTDAICDRFFVTEQSGVDNLLQEGKNPDHIHFVGHVMIDNLFHQLERLETIEASRLSVHGVKRRLDRYIFATLHRPANVDTREALTGIIQAFNTIARDIPIVFPVHPRAQKQIAAFGLELSAHIIQLPPLGFRESLYLWKDAALVMTDSGGLQEETTAIGVPCLTLRFNTERPITLEMGTNKLVGNRKEDILRAAAAVLEPGAGNPSPVNRPPLWDGRAAERICDILADAGGA
ncbi:MAG: UDP-N-acetylglucosamine 2-epimerase (non-hydrolyzing) [Thermodesulfobacteriota bacterium]|nr:UDP-N-acetylglucosamine 2-epimerase (non-hydrolyzing) [Thermodesulfobacteriota bacterium]